MLNVYHKLNDLLPVIFPRFFSWKDCEQNEFVVLDVGQKKYDKSNNRIEDKTQYEAVENHVHLFDSYVGKKNYDVMRHVSITIAQNLFDNLTSCYPNKEFIVFLTVSLQGSIVRFHQKWPDELPYFDENYNYEDVELITFKKG